jgi:hypothetical protein
MFCWHSCCGRLIRWLRCRKSSGRRDQKCVSLHRCVVPSPKANVL